MKKPRLGRCFASYDECKVYLNEIEYIKENWEDIFDKEPTEEEIKDWVDGDSELYDGTWQYFEEEITRRMVEVGSSYWKIEGYDIGWQNRHGLKYVECVEGIDLFRQILPETDMTLYAYRTQRGFALKVSHHDSPMGEWYYITKCAHSTYEKNQ